MKVAYAPRHIGKLSLSSRAQESPCLILMTGTIQIFMLRSSPTQKKTSACKIILQQFIITLITTPAFFIFSTVATEEAEID